MQLSELSVPIGERESAASGTSWGAVMGGAFITLALSLVLIALGAGFGLAVVSPWSGWGASAAAVGRSALGWLIVAEAVAASVGGYLTGRLRTRWLAVHNDEVHFRDTANGLLAWAVATVLGFAFLAAGASFLAGSGVMAVAESGRNGAGAQNSGLEPGAYFVDRLFRSDRLAASENDSRVRLEAGRILAHSSLADMPASDSAYLAQLVASTTGMSSNDAGQRVSGTIAEAKQTADNARKAAARILLSIFFALLMGAFCASFAATIGGRQRHRVRSAEN